MNLATKLRKSRIEINKGGKENANSMRRLPINRLYGLNLCTKKHTLGRVKNQYMQGGKQCLIK